MKTHTVNMKYSMLPSGRLWSLCSIRSRSTPSLTTQSVFTLVSGWHRQQSLRGNEVNQILAAGPTELAPGLGWPLRHTLSGCVCLILRLFAALNAADSQRSRCGSGQWASHLLLWAKYMDTVESLVLFFDAILLCFHCLGPTARLNPPFISEYAETFLCGT